MDQFYTNDDVALRLWNTLQTIVNTVDYDVVLEPSAGKGAFFRLFPESKRIGLDIQPKFEGIEKMDYFDFVPQLEKTYLVVGNPPFGKISSTAVKFFNKSASFADCIAFIVPRTFKRVSVHNQLSLDFHLVYNEDLPVTPCCFTPKMSAKCCFQIWTKTTCPRKIVIYDKTHPDFIFVKHGPKDKKNQPTPPVEDSDFAVKAYGSNCGEIQDTCLDMLRPKSWHWIKSNIDIETLKSRFKSLDYNMSKDTVRQDSLGQQELIYLYKGKF